MDMPVPSSYNDISTDAGLRDHAGWVWYDREFFVPQGWDPAEVEVRVRFGSVHYTSLVYLNGELMTSHSGGHLPFETDLTELLKWNEANRLTVAVNNTLSPHTIPQGEWQWKTEGDKYPEGYFEMFYDFDFFNYAGIHRPVTLYTVPKAANIADMTVTTSFLTTDLDLATLTYTVEVDSATDDYNCLVELIDDQGGVAATSNGCFGFMDVPQPNLWWPYTMSENYGYLYTFKATVSNAGGVSDVYREKIGIRTVDWDTDSFSINHRPFYFRGFGRHEDTIVRGKGLDLPLAARDHNLMKWIGANSYRTSHYPYAEELMDFADRNGVVIIDECPGVNLRYYDDNLRENHKKVMTDLVARDKNHPSVVMWSIANEPKSWDAAAKPYFEAVADHTRALDPTRPTTFAAITGSSEENAGYGVDIVGVNRYYAWYSDVARPEIIERQFEQDLRNFRAKFGKPVIVLEYGADTLSGLHDLPSSIWSEEYQTDLMEENFKVFGTTRAEGWMIGEMVWNFADFMTKQEIKRAGGNKKGVFTRDRQPKASAHLLRSRYWNLANEEMSERGESWADANMPKRKGKEYCRA